MTIKNSPLMQEIVLLGDTSFRFIQVCSSKVQRAGGLLWHGLMETRDGESVAAVSFGSSPPLAMVKAKPEVKPNPYESASLSTHTHERETKL